MYYYEKDDNGNPLTAYSSGIDWDARGYDGFLGFGKQPNGECCVDCICDDTCERSSIFVRYTWQEPCRDLDTKTSFRGYSAGFMCDSSDGLGSDLVWVTGDDTGVGGYELVEIKFEQKSLPTEPNHWVDVELHAHWYGQFIDGCSGKFTIHVTSDGGLPTGENTLLFKEITTGVIDFSCSTNFVAKFRFNATDIIWDE